MTEPAATLADFRKIGARHGANVAACMVAAMAHGVRDPQALMQHHLEHVIPTMRARLYKMGASELEASEYVAASIAATEQMVAELADGLDAAERGI
jgi:hypothetical protein